MHTGFEEIGIEETEKLKGSAEFTFQPQEISLEISFSPEKRKKTIIGKTNGRRNKNNLF
jgi:hypothetical protein